MYRQIIPVLMFSLAIYAVGDILSKYWANTGSWKFALLSFLAYGVTVCGYLWAMNRMNSLAIIGSLWNVGYAIVTILLAFCMFHERVSISQGIGLGLGVVCIFLLTR